MAGAAGGRNDGPAFGHAGGKRLFDKKMYATPDTFQRNVVMQVRRRRDSDCVDAGIQQRVDIVEGAAAERTGDEIPLLAVGVGNAHQFDAGHVREHPRMV